MNKQGNLWSEDVNKRLKEKNSKLPQGERYNEPKWEDSVLQERMMRIGVEYRIYGDREDDIEEIARTTLREDFIQKKL